MKTPNVIEGAKFQDHRGVLRFNNNLNIESAKRIYVIENQNLEDKRGWQGHKIEQRWFSVMRGAFVIEIIQVDDLKNPTKVTKHYEFELSDKQMDVLHVPPGHMTSIRSLKESSALLVMSDFLMGETQDEHRLPINYFDDY